MQGEHEKGAMTARDGLDDAARLLRRFDDNGIDYCLDGGTLLGLIRDRRLLPDDDIDVSLLADAQAPTVIALVRSTMRGKEYRLATQTYAGLLVKAKLLPRRPRSGRRRIDLSFYRAADGVFWRPARKPVIPLRDPASWRPGRLSRTLAYAMFKLLVLPVSENTPIDRWPGRAGFELKTWLVPAAYLQERIRLVLAPGLSAAIPRHYDAYLTYRYGEWRRPAPGWKHWRDDGALAAVEPALARRDPARYVRAGAPVADLDERRP